MADQIDISQYDWGTSQDGNKVIAIPLATLQTRVQHTYETLNIAPGLTIDGRELELVEESLYKDKWITGAYSNCQRRFTIRHKTHVVEDKKDITIDDMIAHTMARMSGLKGLEVNYTKNQLKIETIVQQTLEYVAENAEMLLHDGHTKEDKPLRYFQSNADNLKVNRSGILLMKDDILKRLRK